jgi:hypothetical protein
MNNKNIALILKSVIIIVAILGLMICSIWYPFSISLTAVGTVNTSITLAQKIEIWTQLIFYWLVSIPCFIILIYSWFITNSVKANEVFTLKVSNLLKKCARILLFDLIIFLIGNTIFMCLGWNDFALIYFLLAIIGFCVATVTLIIAHYVTEATKLIEIKNGTF